METDQFTCRGASRLDAAEPVSEVIDAAIETARIELNRESLTPNVLIAEFRKRVRKQFKGHILLIGATLKIETWMENELAPKGYAVKPTFDGRPFYIYDRYRNYLEPNASWSNASVFRLANELGGYCSANSFRVGDVLIGSDKIGHFLDQGYDLWKASLNGGERAAIRFSTESELGFFGMKTIGVFSYADLAANAAGFRFYRDLVAEAGAPDAERAMFVIETGSSGRAELVRQGHFDLRNYVTADWDELINFPVYSRSVWAMVREHVLANPCLACNEQAAVSAATAKLRPRLSAKSDYVDLELARGTVQLNPYRLDALCGNYEKRCKEFDYSRLHCE